MAPELTREVCRIVKDESKSNAVNSSPKDRRRDNKTLA